jgi:hypothetical protein
MNMSRFVKRFPTRFSNHIFDLKKDDSRFALKALKNEGLEISLSSAKFAVNFLAKNEKVADLQRMEMFSMIDGRSKIEICSVKDGSVQIRCLRGEEIFEFLLSLEEKETAVAFMTANLPFIFGWAQVEIPGDSISRIYIPSN